MYVRPGELKWVPDAWRRTWICAMGSRTIWSSQTCSQSGEAAAVASERFSVTARNPALLSSASADVLEQTTAMSFRGNARECERAKEKRKGDAHAVLDAAEEDVR
eukprot:2869979-Rhodomonas_salina.3